MIPPAAVAILRGGIEEAHLVDLLIRPGNVAQRLAQALDDAGWTITPTAPANAPQRAA